MPSQKWSVLIQIAFVQYVNLSINVPSHTFLSSFCRIAKHLLLPGYLKLFCLNGYTMFLSHSSLTVHDSWLWLNRETNLLQSFKLVSFALTSFQLFLWAATFSIHIDLLCVACDQFPRFSARLSELDFKFIFVWRWTIKCLWLRTWKLDSFCDSKITFQ